MRESETRRKEGQKGGETELSFLFIFGLGSAKALRSCHQDFVFEWQFETDEGEVSCCLSEKQIMPPACQQCREKEMREDGRVYVKGFPGEPETEISRGEIQSKRRNGKFGTRSARASAKNAVIVHDQGRGGALQNKGQGPRSHHRGIEPELGLEGEKKGAEKREIRENNGTTLSLSYWNASGLQFGGRGMKRTTASISLTMQVVADISPEKDRKALGLVVLGYFGGGRVVGREGLRHAQLPANALDWLGGLKK